MNNDEKFDYWDIKARRQQGQSWKVIAIDYNTNKGTLYGWFKKISLNPPPKPKILKYNLDEIKRLKFEEELTWNEIGERFGVKGSSICSYYKKYTHQSDNSTFPNKQIMTHTGKFNFVRVDDAFLCPCGCGGKLRSGRKYVSPACRFKIGSKTLATKLVQTVTQPTGNSTLLIQSLLTSTRQEDSPK
ncbi:MAG: hypothetical protein ACFE8J_08755 [Candidatus Heimdallarchaeota archaeon]